jgi:hypothetical protein
MCLGIPVYWSNTGPESPHTVSLRQTRSTADSIQRPPINCRYGGPTRRFFNRSRSPLAGALTGRDGTNRGFSQPPAARPLNESPPNGNLQVDQQVVSGEPLADEVNTQTLHRPNMPSSEEKAPDDHRPFLAVPDAVCEVDDSTGSLTEPEFVESLDSMESDDEHLPADAQSEIIPETPFAMTSNSRSASC